MFSLSQGPSPGPRAESGQTRQPATSKSPNSKPPAGSFAEALANLVEIHNREVNSLRVEVDQLSKQVRAAECRATLVKAPPHQEQVDLARCDAARGDDGPEDMSFVGAPARQLSPACESAGSLGVPNGSSSERPLCETEELAANDASKTVAFESRGKIAAFEALQDTENGNNEEENNGQYYQADTDKFDHCSGRPVMERWTALIQVFFEEMANHRFAQHNPVSAYELLPHWLSKGTHHKIRTSSAYGAAAAEPVLMACDTRIGDTLAIKDSWFQPFMMHPYGPPRLVWAFIGLWLMIWDAITIPLQVFDFGEFDRVFKTVSSLGFVYWAIDIPVSFCIGYMSSEGAFEMRPGPVWRNYIRTWFGLDVLVVALDVAVTLFTDSGIIVQGDSSNAETGVVSVRFARLARLLRLIRLVRARRLKEMTGAITERLGSQHMLLAAKLVKYVFMILMTNHYIACSWYGIAAFNNDSESTWVAAMGLEDASTGYQYLLSLHWSLTQFSPSTNNIAPNNMPERFFSCCVVLIALLVFSSFISSVTNAVNQLRLVNMERLVEEARVREFLMNRNVSTELFARIQHFFKNAYMKQGKRIHERDFAFFLQMPETLLVQMHTELFWPRLCKYSVFQRLSGLDRTFLRRICHTAMEEKSYLSGQDVFLDCIESTGLYCPVEGNLNYTFWPGNRRSMARPMTEAVGNLEWLSEMSLWVAWVHRGHLAASVPSDAVYLDAAEFGLIVSEHNGPLVACLRTFAILIVQVAENHEEENAITDLPFEEDVLEDNIERSIRFLKIRERSNRGSSASMPSSAIVNSSYGAAFGGSGSSSNLGCPDPRHGPMGS